MLSIDDPKEKRETYKNSAIETREAGRLEDALRMLQEIRSWDEAGNNPRGLIDVLGHLKIVYVRLADETEDSDKKKEFLSEAAVCLFEALKIGEKNPEIPQGSRAIQKVHAAGLKLKIAQLETDQEAKERALLEALNQIDEAIISLPGSKAHFAWPANTKAKILYEMGQVLDAVSLLNEAQTWIYEGYDEEIGNDDQAEIKLNVWLSGLHLTLAEIFAKENKPILARHFASSVLNVSDPKNTLGERKKEAKRILDAVPK